MKSVLKKERIFEPMKNFKKFFKKHLINKVLAKHLASVKFDNISIVAYGTPKSTCGKGILFDDEEPNRKEWEGVAYDVNNIIKILKNLE